MTKIPNHPVKQKKARTEAQQAAAANLKRGGHGHGSRPVLSDQVDLFLILLKRATYGIARASIEAGFSPSHGYRLISKPEVQKRLKEVEQERLKVLVARDADLIEELRDFAIAQLMDIGQNGQTSTYGHRDRLEAIRTILQVTGDLPVKGAEQLQVPQTSNETVRYILPPNGNSEHVHTALWLQKKEAEGVRMIESDFREFESFREFKKDLERHKLVESEFPNSQQLKQPSLPQHPPGVFATGGDPKEKP